MKVKSQGNVQEISDSIEKSQNAKPLENQKPSKSLINPSPSEQPKNDIPQDKKGRLIIRNLVYTLGEKQIRQLFNKYGEIVEVNMPIDNATNKNRGFAFVQFKTRPEAIKAISELNGTIFKGRKIAVDLSVPKSVYKEMEKKEKFNNENSDEKIVDEIMKMPKSEPVETKEKPKESKKKHKKVDNKSEDTTEKNDENTDKKPKKKPNKFDEKTTLFVRNIGFDTTEEEFREYFETYGEINYAKLCMNHETKMHKGTGFVQYKNEADAQRMLELSKEAEAYYDSQKLKKKPKKDQNGIFLVEMHKL